MPDLVPHDGSHDAPWYAAKQNQLRFTAIMTHVASYRPTIFYLAGPRFPGTSAARAARLAVEINARMIGIGHHLWRFQCLDACFPICLVGWRISRPQITESPACIKLAKGERLF
ncbi:MAG: hypothetical protein HY692_04720 [Cyanobacteria bacterium NC_groundwater_1444_Ag_S-0.65um_54_12]|nr:hypothetical protein [Cyanobacteria bacterium NC_groundwater_1444_Ag_S-0.65um_54_12]